MLKLTEASKCRLWKGSLLQISYDGGYMSNHAVETKIHRLENIDDLTTGEKELLRCLKLDLKNNKTK